MDNSTTLPTAMANAVKSVNGVVTAPLIGNVDTVHLFFTVGVVLVAVIAWSRILAHIKG